MEEIKRRLMESGVIGRVVDDFNPLMLLAVSYGDRLIRLGDQVTPTEVQHKPTFLQHSINYQDLQDTFNNRELVALVSLILVFVDILHNNRLIFYNSSN